MKAYCRESTGAGGDGVRPSGVGRASSRRLLSGDVIHVRSSGQHAFHPSHKTAPNSRDAGVASTVSATCADIPLHVVLGNSAADMLTASRGAPVRLSACRQQDATLSPRRPFFGCEGLRETDSHPIAQGCGVGSHSLGNHSMLLLSRNVAQHRYDFRCLPYCTIRSIFRHVLRRVRSRSYCAPQM
jgi:hypothetical protein